ncbi:MAG: hypothetical protein EXS08_12100 [Planctomycetes bacterium]|nr:hypothetical protein [Planctomycetota bacterium]
MSNPFSRRVLASLRRAFGRRRAPRPRDQEWLRLILLVRRLQSGQLTIAKRFDEVRSLSGALGSFRSDIDALREQLASGGAREPVHFADASASPRSSAPALERGLAQLDAVTARLETVAAQVPTELPFKSDLDAVLGRLGETAARLEGAEEAVLKIGGQDELARLYERIQEMAETFARTPQASTEDQEKTVDPRLGELLERVELALQAQPADALAEPLARLEALTESIGSEPQPGTSDTGLSEALLARFEALAERFESSPSALPDLPSGSILAGGEVVDLRAEVEDQRAKFQCELESRRRVEAELEALRAQLRSSELTRMEIESRHSSELAQVADHARRKIVVLEEDLKKKKRGLAELTQQNIALQTALARHSAAADSESPAAAEPASALPRKGSAPLSKLMRPDGTGDGSAGA